MSIRETASNGWVWGIGVIAVVGLVGLVVAINQDSKPPAPRDGGVQVVPDNFAKANAGGLPFTVPAEFEAELVAGPPLVKHPMFGCFDDRGRLYVAGSSGHNLGPAELLESPPDVIRRLEDTDGDGRFDRSEVFADGLTYPQGVLWHDGAVYTASPPSLWRLEDTDGDGVADDRKELFTGFPLTGIADDLHGPSLGPDGWIYWGVGRFPYEIRRPGSPVFRKGQAPLILRSRADGSNLEMVSSGLGNPVEVTFTPEGEPIACGTFFAPPSMGAGARDAIIHCVEGGVFPVLDRVPQEDKWTGDLLPPLVLLEAAAPSGITRARGGLIEGNKGGPVLFSAFFNMHKVQTHRLEREGATFKSHDDDFLVSDVADFHPTDVFEDADGSLLVVDTGGWFRSCPTSQIDKADTLGAIYRIKRRGAPPVEDPRGLTLDWSSSDPASFVERLNDPRFAVRERAVDRLVGLGKAAIPALEGLLKEGTEARSRREAVWTLARIEDATARAAIRPALNDADPSVRLAAVKAVGLHRDAGSLDALIALAREGDPTLRRETATALGRIGEARAVPALLEGLRTTGDRFLDHAQIFALIQINDSTTTQQGLTDANANVRRGALIALDQMADGDLTPELVTPLLNPAEPALEQAAIRIIASRPAWPKTFVEVLRPWLTRNSLTAHEKDVLRGILPTISQDPAVQGLIASVLQSRSTPLEIRLLLLEEIGQTHLPHLPQPWLESLGKSLSDLNPRVVRQAASTIGNLGLSDFETPLLQLASDPALPKDLRIEAFEATAPHVARVDPKIFTFLCDRLAKSEPPLRRMAAARCLGLARLDTDQLRTLCEQVSRAGALALPRLLRAYQRNSDYEVGTQLVSALSRAPGLKSLSGQALIQTFESYPPEVREQIKPLLKRLDLKVEDKAALLAKSASILNQGVADRGRDLFFGVKAACSTCHTVQGQGGHVGPDLSRIGAVRNGRDLLEAVLFPSSSFARGYEPYLVATKDGRTMNAVITHESANEITFVNPVQGVLRLPRNSIASLKPGQDSLMPRGLDENLSTEELGDLFAYLKTLH